MFDTNNRASNHISFIDSDLYANWVFSGGHPTQGRRFALAAQSLHEQLVVSGLGMTVINSDLIADDRLLGYAHSLDYITEVTIQGLCDEWSGPREDLANLAQRMAGGTVLAVESLLQQTADISVHFAGAKHHAMRGNSSGFCVFNDFAIAATHALLGPRPVRTPHSPGATAVERIAILDIDAHHGDGTEALLGENPQVLTFSIHDSSIFPGTGFHDDPGNHVFNRPLAPGSGDHELLDAVAGFITSADSFAPDMLFVAMGADGLDVDPLSTLQYSFEGLEEAVRTVRQRFPHTPLLLGGAGGYRPDDATPQAWVRMVIAAATA
jgi:acetoin utilization protein AcuC